MCVYLIYIIDIHSTHTYYVNKTFFFVCTLQTRPPEDSALRLRNGPYVNKNFILDKIDRLTALIWFISYIQALQK